jgi:hypothetical protein
MFAVRRTARARRHEKHALAWLLPSANREAVKADRQACDFASAVHDRQLLRRLGEGDTFERLRPAEGDTEEKVQGSGDRCSQSTIRALVSSTSRVDCST